MAYLRSYVTGCNDAILNEVGRTTVMSLVGLHHGPGCVRTQLWDTSLWSSWAMSVLESGLV
jgi:hypothetical protein